MYVCMFAERERERVRGCVRARTGGCVCWIFKAVMITGLLPTHLNPRPRKRRRKKNKQVFGNNCFVSVLQLCPTCLYCLLLFRSCANASVCVTGLWFQLSLLRKLAIRARKRIQILTVETPATHLSCRVQAVLPHARAVMATLGSQAVIVVSYNYF